MKKSLIALAVLGSFAGVVSAQTSVTVFGGGDVGYRNVTSGANKFSGASTDGIYSSRLGFRGTEELGGGLSALFHFEGGMQPDAGTNAKLDFRRKSVIGLAGGFGEVRMGRDYTLTFTVTGFDPFGTNGVGSANNFFGNVNTNLTALTAGTFVTNQAAVATTAASNTVQAGQVLGDPNQVRANNMFAYYSPKFGGFTFGLQQGFGSENNANAKGQQKATQLKGAFDQGPISVALALGSTKGGDTAAAAPTDTQKWKTTILGASYDFGVAKIRFINQGDKLSGLDGGVTAKSSINLLGVTAPVGALTLKASFMNRKVDATGASKITAGTQIAFGAVYDLSKRTSVYGTYSQLKNKAGFANSVGSAAVSDYSGLTSKGYEAGVKVTF